MYVPKEKRTMLLRSVNNVAYALNVALLQEGKKCRQGTVP